MRRILSLLVLAFFINSCSVGDDEPIRSFSLLAIDSVEINETYPLHEISPIMVTYRRPTDCYIFDGFYIQGDGFNNTIAVQALSLDRNDCVDDSMNTFSVPLEFSPTTPGEYTFKFYMGSPAGFPIYEEHIVTVE